MPYYTTRRCNTKDAIKLDHSLTVTARPETQATDPAGDADAEDPQAQAEPRAAAEAQATEAEQGSRTGAGQQAEPSNGGGGAIGSEGSTDLSGLMLGGSMLTGLGLMLVRRRRDRAS